jgi:hypothetical protein
VTAQEILRRIHQEGYTDELKKVTEEYFKVPLFQVGDKVKHKRRSDVVEGVVKAISKTGSRIQVVYSQRATWGNRNIFHVTAYFEPSNLEKVN